MFYVRYNIYEKHQMLGYENLFAEIDTAIHPPGDWLLLDCDSGNECENGESYSSCNQLLIQTDMRIQFGGSISLNTLKRDDSEKDVRRHFFREKEYI